MSLSLNEIKNRIPSTDKFLGDTWWADTYLDLFSVLICWWQKNVQNRSAVLVPDFDIFKASLKK